VTADNSDSDEAAGSTPAAVATADNIRAAGVAEVKDSRRAGAAAETAPLTEAVDPTASAPIVQTARMACAVVRMKLPSPSFLRDAVYSGKVLTTRGRAIADEMREERQRQVLSE